MNEVTTFAPQVMIDGVAYTPRGWEWILGFAAGGCQWAIDQARTPEFQQRMCNDIARHKIEILKRAIDIKKREVELMEEQARDLSNLISGPSTRKLDV